MSWSLFGALSSVINKKTPPEPIQKLLYHTEDEIDNLVADEDAMETVGGSVHAINEIIDTRMIMDKVTDSEIAMDKVTDSEIAMDKVMSKVMSRDKFYDAPNWVDKGVYNRSVWAGESILTESNWKQNLTFDQITDDETLMDEFTDSEQSMEDSTDSEIAMDKVIDKLMPFTKILNSPYNTSHLMAKNMPSEKLWDNGFSDRDTGNVEYSLVDGDYGGYALEINGTDDDGETYLAKAVLDLTDYNTAKFQVDYNNGFNAYTEVYIDDTEVYSGDHNTFGSKEISLDISEYGEVEVGIGGLNRDDHDDTFENTWHHIILEE